MPYLAALKPHLVVVGEDGNRYGEMNNLKLLAEQLDIKNSITFTGWLIMINSLISTMPPMFAFFPHIMKASVWYLWNHWLAAHR
jgi:hypothetical protein